MMHCGPTEQHSKHWATRYLNFDERAAGHERLIKLNELEELRLQAYDNAAIYKEKTKHFHDKRLKRKEFEPGQQALLYNSRFKFTAGKLCSKWSGPFLITKVSPYGAVKLFDPKTSTEFKARDVKQALNGRQPTILKTQKYIVFRGRTAEFDGVNKARKSCSAAIMPRCSSSCHYERIRTKDKLTGTVHIAPRCFSSWHDMEQVL
ncbi:hypothetical protein A2U01_0011526 [Trifolium medium]|uniref:Uncharacterized protein n=1 Tax=Trifolium medium TaxID=97028 RepID=A0A392MV91_9FABA|nr:hypothetical protein [Trifolium medium]